ncbi:MAG: RDD family protein [Chloroflexi bacterium]|nr:MAG: RDD family protein [Chloroflexota bacterium]
MTIAMGRLEIETPDHVVLRFQLAGAGNRGFAAMADFLIASVLVYAMDFAFQKVTEIEPSLADWSGWFVFSELVIAWLYFVLLEWLWNGQTIGKRIFGLRVISEDGEPARFVAVVVRNLVRVIDFLPAFYGLGLVTLIVSSRSQRLGDYAGGTFVVRAPRPRRNWSALRTLSALPRWSLAEGQPATGPTLRVLPGEAQRLVREFVLREQKLTPAARMALAKQLAERLRSLLPEFQVADDVELIRTVARSLRAKGDEER